MKKSESFFLLDPIIEKILVTVLKSATCEAIILFGSRARGDFNSKSDYDIAVKGMSEKDFAKINDLLADNDFTLKKIEILMYEQLNESYKKSVDTEGIVLYER